MTAETFEAAGFVDVDHRPFEVSVPMTRRAYVDYLLTESFLVDAVRHGEDREAIRAWITETVPWIDDERSDAEVVFAGYLLTARTPT